MSHRKTKPRLREYFEGAFREHLLDRSNGGRSVRAFRVGIGRFVDYCGEDPFIDDITHNMLLGFKAWLIAELKVSQSTTSNYGTYVACVARHHNPQAFPIVRAKKVAPKLPPPQKRTLDWCFHLYLKERPLKVSSIDNFQQSINHISRHLDRVATVEDLNHTTLNDWLTAAAAADYKPRTMHGRRGDLMSLWNWAYHDSGLTTLQPCRVRKVKVPYEFPEAWPAADLRKLLAAAKKLQGKLRRGGLVRDFWDAWIRVCYETALRPCDMLLIQPEHISKDGRVTIVQEKTGLPLVSQLTEATLAAIKRMCPPVEQPIFGAIQTRHGIYHTWGRLLKLAGLTGTPKKLRKTSATLLEKASPGAATLHLRHRSPDMARRHYLDPRLLVSVRPMPPALEGGAQ